MSARGTGIPLRSRGAGVWLPEPRSAASPLPRYIGKQDYRCDQGDEKAKSPVLANPHYTAQSISVPSVVSAESSYSSGERCVIGLKTWYSRSAHVRLGQGSSVSSSTSEGSSHGIS